MLYPSKVKEILVVQTGSPASRDKRQRLNLIGLGLNKIGRQRILKNDSSIAGMIKKVHHLVKHSPVE